MQTASIKKQITTFVTGTYGLSWLLFFIGHQANLLPIILLGIWAPTLISIALNWYYFGTNGVKTLFSRFKRVNVKWYYWALLLLLPAAINYTGLSVWQLISNGENYSLVAPSQYWLGVIIPSFIIAGLGEELGWRGFMLPRLQRLFSPVKATLILASIHMLWHLPTYWLGQGIHNVPFIFILTFLFPWTILFVWLYNKSGGSLIFAVSFHAISNASLSIVRFMPLEEEVPITPDLITQTSLPSELAGPYLTVCFVYIVIAMLVLWKGKFNQVNTDIP